MILARSMTDKAAVKGPVMQISALLRPKTLFTTPCREYVTIRVLYSTANDPQPQMIPRPQMILDRK